MHIMFQLNIIIRIVEYTLQLFFIDSIDFLGGWTLKEIIINLAVDDSQGKL